VNLIPGMPLQELSNAFDENPEIGCNKLMIVYFCGLAGLGKSSLI